jgi:hypothetical protein
MDRQNGGIVDLRPTTAVVDHGHIPYRRKRSSLASRSAPSTMRLPARRVPDATRITLRITLRIDEPSLVGGDEPWLTR